MKIKGGLGNQLFQYSAGYYLKKKLGAELCLDYSSAKAGKLMKCAGIKQDFSYRSVQLECFSLDPHKVQSSVFTFAADQIIRKISQENGYTGHCITRIIKDGADCRDDSTETLMKARKDRDVIIDGYWQNIHFIKPIRDELIRQYKMKLETGQEYNEHLKRINNSVSVGVHVRRGDFVTLGWDKEIDYYIQAMAVAREEIPGAKFYIFSDEPEWVRNNLSDGKNCFPISIHEEHPDVKEFDLLRKCQHQIISESTFGWWAAYLNENSEKKVYVPFDCRGNIWLGKWKRI